MSTDERDARKHVYVHQQRVEPHAESDNKYPPVVEVVALLPAKCKTHHAPIYGCVHGDSHFTFCEDVLKPLSSTNKRKMN